MGQPKEYQLITLSHGTCPICDSSADTTADGWKCQNPRCGTGFAKGDLEAAAFAPMVTAEQGEVFFGLDSAKLTPEDLPIYTRGAGTSRANRLESELFGSFHSHPSTLMFIAGIGVAAEVRKSSIALTQALYPDARSLSLMRELRGTGQIIENFPPGSYSFGFVDMGGAIIVEEKNYNLTYSRAVWVAGKFSYQRIFKESLWLGRRYNTDHSVDAARYANEFPNHRTEEKPELCGQCHSCAVGHNEPPHCLSTGLEVSLNQTGCDEHFDASL